MSEQWNTSWFWGQNTDHESKREEHFTFSWEITTWWTDDLHICWLITCLPVLTCPHLQFEGSSLRQLVSKICRGRYNPVSTRYSYELRLLLSQLFKVRNIFINFNVFLLSLYEYYEVNQSINSRLVYLSFHIQTAGLRLGTSCVCFCVESSNCIFKEERLNHQETVWVQDVDLSCREGS